MRRAVAVSPQVQQRSSSFRFVEDASRQVAPHHGGAQWQAAAGLFAAWGRAT